jgi:CRP/FNR family transcriptional regulator, cyclic AMP receptor protein
MELEMEKDDSKKKVDPNKKDDPKFARPAPSKLYRPEVALQFFKSAGKAESFAQGKAVFVEDEGGASAFSEGARMYLLLDGEVTLSVQKKVVGTVRKGEVFGEMASISQLPRTATAVASKPCSVISLNDKQFQAGLAKLPEFALMLMNIIISRLRETVSNLTSGGKLAEKDRWNKVAVFDRKLLADLEREFEDNPASVHPLNKVIMKEGDRGIFMYVVQEGVVAISIGEKVVEKIGPGGVFGEMALVDQASRVATATAETDCTLLGINRNDFLDLVKTKPAFALSLLKTLSERLRFMTSMYK